MSFKNGKNTSRNSEQLTMLLAKSVAVSAICAFVMPQVIGLATATVISVCIYGLTTTALFAAYCLSKQMYKLTIVTGNILYGLGLISKGYIQLAHLRIKERYFDKPELQSFTDYAQKMEALLWKTKHIPCISLINTFLTARGKTAKMAALLGIWQLYTTEPPSKQIQDQIVKILPLITDGIEAAKKLWESRNEEEEVMVEADEVDEPVAEQQPAQDGGEQEGEEDSFSFKDVISEMELNTKLEKNRRIITVAMAVVAGVACFVPATVTWALSDRKDFTKHVIDMGRFITAKNIIWTEVDKTKNVLLKGLWNICGQEYIPDSDKAAQLVQKKVVAAMIMVREYEVLLNTDFFGAMRDNKLEKINEAMAEIDKIYKDLSSLQKSQYNLNTIITQLREGMNALNAKRSDLMANATGKQEPVVIALYGEAGMGKSELMKRIVNDLEKAYGITSYLRKPTDEYWSLFQGQQIIVWDDLGFKKDGKDYAEFCNHTCGVASTAIGAAIQDKGRPTNPLFIITTSNVGYIGPANSEIVTLDAYHRRRHILIEVHNNPAAEYKRVHGATMPPELFRPEATTLTLAKPIPDVNGDNILGATTYDRVLAAAMEMEKNFANRFKDQLRLKSYYKGKIPPNVEVDREKLTTAFLLGKPVANDNEQVYRPAAPKKQAVNPLGVEIDRKYPVFVISGPSGTGKTHLANALCQRLYGMPAVKTDIDKINWAPNEIIYLDDITMSKERYLKAAEIANQQYETGVARIVIMTENSSKLYLMDQQAVAEVHRRSHLATLSYRWKWSQIFRSWSQIATDHKAELEDSNNKQAVMRSNIAAKVTEYGQRPVPRHATDVASIFGGFETNVYGDEVVTNGVWTLPMPSEVDFTVNLSKSFRELADCKMSQLCTSLFTGSIYQVRNISHRFSQITSVGIITDIFNQAPDFQVRDIDHMITSFNDANVEVKIKPPGVAILTTPEGAIGLTWLEKTIRMFKITTDPVELIDNKIDIHRYFNKDVESDYARLTSSLVFTEESIKNTEQAIKEIQVERFSATNILCQILDASLTILSLSVQVIAPVALIGNMLTETCDRSELAYLKTVMGAAYKFKKERLDHREAPIIELSGNQKTMEEFDALVAMGEFTEDEVAYIMINNPAALSYITHDKDFTYPALFAAMKNKQVPVPADPVLENITLTPQTRYHHTYNEGGDFKKAKAGCVVLEKFRNKAAYDDWKNSTQFDEWKIKTGQFKVWTTDKADRKAFDWDNFDSTGIKTGTPDDWSAEWESSPVKGGKKKRTEQKVSVAGESSPVKANKKKNEPAKLSLPGKESSPVKDKKKAARNVEILSESSPVEKTKKIETSRIRQKIEVTLPEGGEYHEYSYPKTVALN